MATRSRHNPPQQTPTPPPLMVPSKKLPPGQEQALPQQGAPLADPEDVRTRAYYLWMEAGCPEGDGVRFWTDAEQQMRQPKNR
jgi:hypothetical protein